MQIATLLFTFLKLTICEPGSNMKREEYARLQDQASKEWESGLLTYAEFLATVIDLVYMYTDRNHNFAS